MLSFLIYNQILPSEDIALLDSVHESVRYLCEKVRKRPNLAQRLFNKL